MGKGGRQQQEDWYVNYLFPGRLGKPTKNGLRINRKITQLFVFQGKSYRYVWKFQARFDQVPENGR